MSIVIKRLADPAQFDQLYDRWAGLAPHGGNLFLDHAWLGEWWRVYGHGRELWTLVAEEHGRPTAILPLVLERGRGGVRRLAFMGGGEVAPNHLDVLGDGQSTLAVEAFADFLWLSRASWDVLDLVSVADNSPLCGPWADALRRRGCDTRVSLHTRCAYAALPTSFEHYIQSRSQNTRAEFRRKSRKFRREHPDARFAAVADEAELGAVFDAMVRLHQARWHRLGEPGAFASGDFTDFHRAAARAALRGGTLRLYYLRVGGELVAAKYCYRAGPTVAYYAAGFDERFGNYSVGIQLLGHAIEQSILEGAAEFDFLQGDESYKEDWSTGHRDNWRLTVAAPHFRGRLAAWAASATNTARGLWRRHVPINTRRLLKSLVRGTPRT